MPAQFSICDRRRGWRWEQRRVDRRELPRQSLCGPGCPCTSHPGTRTAAHPAVCSPSASRSWSKEEKGIMNPVLRIRNQGSGAFSTPGSGIRDGKKSIRIRDEQPRSYFRELRNHFFGVKILKFFAADPDPRWKKLGSGINIPDPQHCVIKFRFLSSSKRIDKNSKIVWHPIPYRLISLLYRRDTNFGKK